MSWRATGIPEFVSFLERDFKQPGLWEAGSLKAASRVLNGLEEVGSRTVWAGCEAVRALLLQLPELVGAENTAVFVTGHIQVDSALLSDEATADLRRWYAWIHELYGLALSMFGKDPDPDAVVGRLSELIYGELDAFLVARVRHWAQRRAVSG
jgi:hypothetical protein